MQRPWFEHYAPGVPHDVEIPEAPLTRFLTDSAERFGTRPALNFLGRRISYAELDALTNRFSAALTRLGVGKGDRVAIMLPNVPQCVIAYYGALKIGAVVVQTNPLYLTEELDFQMRDSGARVLVALDLFRDRITPMFDGSPLESVIYCGVRDYLPTVLRWLYPIKAKREGSWNPFVKTPPDYEFTDLIARAPATPAGEHAAAEDVALLQYTGGTTGRPKGVILTHKNLVANTLQCKAWVEDIEAGTERFLGVIPFFHVYGMTTCMNLSIGMAGELILLPRFKPLEVLKAIAKYHPTLFPGIQAMYLAINNHPDAGRYDLSSIRACISGAGALQAEVQKRFEALTGASVVEGYGLSEASPVTHANPIGGMRVKGAIGLPLPGTDARVMSLEDGVTEVPAGEVGELVVKGPQVMRGYWNQSEETLDTLKGGWLHTGDMARMDENGFFYLVDRKKDMIKTGGENVYPRDVEEVLFRHPNVSEAVVAGLPDDFLGERIKAYVVLNEGEEATPDEIIAFCAEHLAKFKVPKQVEIRTELPKTIVGKVLRRVLIEEEEARIRDESSAAPDGG
ncbi:MAG: long-chain fatty acid--CoA ligase [Leptospirillia bacterium]